MDGAEKCQKPANIKQFRLYDHWLKVTPKPQTLALSTASIHRVPDIRPQHNLNSANQVCGNYTSNSQMSNHRFLGL